MIGFATNRTDKNSFENLLCRAAQVPRGQFSPFNYFKDGVGYAIIVGEFPTDFTDDDCQKDYPETNLQGAEDGLTVWKKGEILMARDVTGIVDTCQKLGLDGYQNLLDE